MIYHVKLPSLFVCVLYCLSVTRCFSFWLGIIKDVDMFNLGINRTLGNGLDTSFWLDRWHGECALYCCFPNLFQMSVLPSISVHDTFINGLLHLDFNRQLNGIYLSEWNQLNALFPCTPITSINPDLPSWRWSSSGLFMVHYV